MELTFSTSVILRNMSIQNTRWRLKQYNLGFSKGFVLSIGAYWLLDQEVNTHGAVPLRRTIAILGMQIWAWTCTWWECVNDLSGVLGFCPVNKIINCSIWKLTLIKCSNFLFSFTCHERIWEYICLCLKWKSMVQIERHKQIESKRIEKDISWKYKWKKLC